MLVRTRAVLVAAATLALVLALAACTSSPPADPDPTPTATPTPAPAVPPSDPAGVVDGRINPALLGTHVGGIIDPAQPAPARAGAIRLWDSGVAWRELEPVKGQIDWARMDAALQRAEATGATEILWVHGSTPAWAALDPQAAGLYGPGTSSPPDEQAYLDILRQVAER
jgi:hypothetical protein